MIGTTKIDWTDGTWNPVTGCTKFSAGCDHCYAAKMAPRLRGMGHWKYRNGFEVTCHPEVLMKPYSDKKPKKIFVNSMSDLFHDDVSEDFIWQTFEAMGAASWHKFQVLTKRAERLAAIASELPWYPNIWMGVTIENDNAAYRAELLRQTPAAVKFVSLEPLLSPLPSLDVVGLDWVIVGGETGPGARPMLEPWVRDLRDCAVGAGVPFFFKQWGGPNNKTRGKLVQGRRWTQFPA